MKAKTDAKCASIARRWARFACAAFVGLFTFAASAAEVVISTNTTWTAADVAELDPSDTIAISAGVELTFDLTDATGPVEVPQVITGKGKIKQRGTSSELILSGANTHEGGYYTAADGAVVRARTATAFGTGTVRSQCTRNYIVLETGTATFANTFDMSRAYFVFDPTADNSTITVSGPVRGRGRLMITMGFKGEQHTRNNCHFVFDNTVTAMNDSNQKTDICFGGYLAPRPRVDFNGKVTAMKLRNCNLGGDDWEVNGPGNGYYYFNAVNDVDTFIPYWSTYYPTVLGAFPETCLISSADARKDKNYRHASAVDFGGLSMTVGSLALLDPVAVYTTASNYDYGYLISASPATLTVSGGGTYVTDANFRNQLSFDWNPPEDGDTIIISNRLHTTSGKFTVSKGTVQVVGDTSAENLSEIAVGPNARFLLASTRANALKSLSRVTVADGGIFEIDAGTTPLSGSTLVLLDGTAKIVLGDGVQAKIGLVMTNGVAVADGTYQSGADWLVLGEDASATLDKTIFPQNLWVGANGSWSTVANWSKGAVPSTAFATALTLPKPSYTVTVGAAAGSIGALAVSNEKAGQTATLSVASSLQVGDGAKALDIGAGGLVDVPDGGTLSMAAGTVESTALRAWVHDGGQMTVKGTVDQTGRKGTFVVQDDGEVAVSGNGVLKVYPGNVAAGMTVANGGSLTVTDDAQVHFSAYSWGGKGLVVEKGGTLDVSGNAVVGLIDGGTATTVFGDGTMTFRENATFGRTAAGASGGYYFAAGSGAPTGTVTFLDHATFLDTRDHFYFDRGNGTTARLELYSDSQGHVFNWITILGGAGARGECVITNGALLAKGMGLWLGGVNSRGTALADAVSEGYFRVAGDAVVNLQNNNDATCTFNGLLVGDCARATKIPGTDKYFQDTRCGLLELADNAVIRTAYNTPEIMFGVGSTNAVGRFVQTGGEIVGDTVSGRGHIALGVGGGQGEWLMTGGKANLPFNVYVGGATLDDLGKTATPSNYAGTDADHAGKAKGTLKLLGGTFAIGRNEYNLRNLVLSSDGVGTLYLGKDAKLSVNGQLIAKTGSKLVVDMRGCTDRRKTLATFGGTTTAFASENITLLQDEGAGYEVVVTDTSISAKRVYGLIMMIK